MISRLSAELLIADALRQEYTDQQAARYAAAQLVADIYGVIGDEARNPRIVIDGLVFAEDG